MTGESRVRRRARRGPGDAGLRRARARRGEALRPDRRRRLHAAFPERLLHRAGLAAPRPGGGSRSGARRCRPTRTACGSTRASGTAPTASARASRSPCGSPGSTRRPRSTESGIVPITDIARSLDGRQPRRPDRRPQRQAPADLGRARQLRAGVAARAAHPAGEEPARGAPLRRRAAQAAHRERQADPAERRVPRAARPRRGRARGAGARRCGGSSRRSRAPASRAGTWCWRGTSPSRAAQSTAGADAAHARHGVRGAGRHRPRRSGGRRAARRRSRSRATT